MKQVTSVFGIAGGGGSAEAVCATTAPAESTIPWSRINERRKTTTTKTTRTMLRCLNEAAGESVSWRH